MENDKEITSGSEVDESAVDEMTVRREALKKLGKYAAYVAPFTVMAFSAKAATASGPGRHNTPAR